MAESEEELKMKVKEEYKDCRLHATDSAMIYTQTGLQ